MSQVDFLGAGDKTNINQTLSLFGHWPDRFSMVVNTVWYAIVASKWIALVGSPFSSSSCSTIDCITLEDGTDYEPFYVVGEHENKASLGPISSKPDSHRTHMV